MKRRRALGLALLLPFLVPGLGGCASVGASAPPDWAYFDVVVHPGGGIPATLGFYGGAAAWSPVGFVLGSLLPYPADEWVARVPGEVLGTGIGLVLGAPFHLVALPFGSSGPKEVMEVKEVEKVPRGAEGGPPGGGQGP